MSFAARARMALDSEEAVLQQLKESGWRAFKFGQGLMPEEFRNALKTYRDDSGRVSLVRWFPDIIAFKPSPRIRVVLFDVKADSGKTENYAIETKALETCEAFQRHFFTPCWFIWKELIVLTPECVRDNSWPGPPPTFGSGTPYVLISKRHAKNLDLWLTGEALNDTEADKES